MKLKCHAMWRNGRVCGNQARTFRDGRPVCDRHRLDSSGLTNLTAESVWPNDLVAVRLYADWLNGASIKSIARLASLPECDIEGFLREAARG